MRLGLRWFCLFVAAWAACAQQDRISGEIDTARTAVLKGNRSSRAMPQYDRGPVDPGQLINGITIVFQRSAGQQAALEQLLAEQQDPTSPNYHHWIAPEEFADRFGLSSSDVAKVTEWLRSQGFGLAYEARSRMYVTCSGTAAQVLGAFHTELDRYQVDGEMHFANSSDPSSPAALEPVVQLVQGLDDFRPKAPPRQLRAVADFTYFSSHYLVPADIATIYDINPLYQKGITGSGQKIAVVGQSNINLSDIEYFRGTLVGLAKNDPQLVLVPGSTDPGTSSQGDQGESTIDLEYAGGIAQNATLLFVYSTNVDTSTQYAIDQNLAPVISYSYGECELTISSTTRSANFYRSLAQQANVEGITWMVSTGDTGAAECDNGVPIATHGLAVQIPSSVPEVTAVGGTEFNEGGGKYWSTGNNPTTGASALGYIPEMAWNDTPTSVANGGWLSSTGGGASIFFSKPAWQTGQGVPNDGARDVPDLSFSSSSGHDPYIVWLNGAVNFFGGTSLSTPIFAGAMTLLNQYLVSNGAQSQPGLGNINPALYSLAQTEGVFHDVTVGNNIVPCASGSPNCVNGQLGYSAGPGYDLATGLGSADINNLFTHWPGQPGQAAGATATTTTLTANPATFPISSTTVLTATVTAASGATTPNGSLSFNAGTNALGTVALSGLGAVATASLTVYGSQLAAGANTISVAYGGSTSFKPSLSSATVNVTVPTAASAVIPSLEPNPVYQQAAAANGCTFFFTVRLSEIAGVATTLTEFTFGGNDYSTSIPALFGSGNIPAHGALSAALCATIATVPSTLTLGFSGADASGQKWTQQTVAPFYPAQVSASMALSSLPGTEVENPNGDPRCDSNYPFYQELNLEEQNGHEVYLNKFLAGGSDLSGEIATWFGSLRLAPLGALQAGICWQLGTMPSTLSYEIDGVDTAGHEITATASVPFNLPPAQSGGTLAASPTAVNLNVAGQESVTASVGVNLATGQVWSASLFPDNQTTSWLVVYPQSGTGPGQVNLVASGAGLASGVYTAMLVFESVNTIPQFVNVPITLTIGASSSVSISSVGNGASFQQAFAPGMILSVFGSNLSGTNLTASTAPLPYTLAGVSASINGVPAPLYGVYASGSTSQINLQIPYETPARTAVLAVNNNGQVATYSFNVSPANPGIFVAHPSGLLTPIGSVAPGQSLEFYITGEGDVSPFVTTGSTPAGAAIAQPPVPRLPLSMTVGGVPVTPTFVGTPSWSVGVTQVNFTMPANMPAGNQPVVVTVGGVASAPVSLNVQTASADAQFTIPPTQQASDGSYHYATQLDEIGGVGVNFTRLVVFGTDYTSQLTNWLGATRIPANGTLSGSFVATCPCNPPWDGTWQITGTDDNGNTNTWSGMAHFLPAATSPDLSPAPRPLAAGNDAAASDASRGPVQVYPAWQAAISSTTGSPSRLFDLLLNSGLVPPWQVEGAQNAKEVDRRDQ
jgi:uncharacterized protein (TIGR03437 family)